MTVVLALHITFYNVVCSRPVTQKRKSAVLSIQWLSMYIQHIYIFELHQIYTHALVEFTSSVRAFADDMEDQTYIPEPESNNIPDGTPPTYKKSVEEETMGCNTGEGG